MSHKLQEYKEAGMEDFILGTKEYAGELTIEVKADKIHDVCLILKEKFGFNYLADISAVDYYTDELRFGLAYNLLNLDSATRLRIACRVEESKPEVRSVRDIWKAADWCEREAFDMLGILFEGHPDLRRIFLPEDFEYFPLRKEFPLIGIPGSIQMPEKGPDKEYK